MFCSYLVLVLLLTFCKTQDEGPRLLTSSYSQVSRSGSARSSTRQSSWPHSSDVRIMKGPNLPTRIKPNERMPIKKNFEDSTGEVQERFNPRPWFAYEQTVNKGPGLTYIPPENNNKPINIQFNSRPISLPQEKPSSSLETPFQINVDKPPPKTYGAPSTDAPNFVTPNNDYMSSEQENKPTDLKEELSSKPNEPDEMDLSPPAVPYKYSPNDENDGDDHPVNNHFHPGFPEYLEHDPNFHGHDLNFHHHDHPVYYEIKTTTPKAPENQRLNKRPYSYYYIGRKLWYIPLYFSVYFIIYIFVLILKSIARHKITFNHYFEEDKREMKSEDQAHEEHIHEVEHHVLGDLENARRKYLM